MVTVTSPCRMPPRTEPVKASKKNDVESTKERIAQMGAIPGRSIGDSDNRHPYTKKQDRPVRRVSIHQ